MISKENAALPAEIVPAVSSSVPGAAEKLLPPHTPPILVLAQESLSLNRFVVLCEASVVVGFGTLSRGVLT